MIKIIISSLVFLVCCSPVAENPHMPDFKVYSSQTAIGFEIQGEERVDIFVQPPYGQQTKVKLYQSHYRCEWGSHCDTTITIIKQTGSAMGLERGMQYKVTVNDSSFMFSTLDSMILETKIVPVPAVLTEPGYYNFQGDTISYIQINSDSVHVDNFVLIGGRRQGVKGEGKNDVIISRGHIKDFQQGILVGGVRWWIVNNIISGQPSGYESRSNYSGILTDTMNTVTISGNKMYYLGDAISTAYGNRFGGRYNIDIFDNYIHDVEDDGIELYGSNSNVRVWRNIIIDAGNHGISAQPQASGVWYILDNYIEGLEMMGAIKLFAVDNMVITGNTFINEGVRNNYYSDVAVLQNAHNLTQSVFENNTLIYHGENRGENRTSYVYYSNKGVFDIPQSNTNIYPDTTWFKLKNW